jgi:transcriptional regulator GlxA family with amidase domain
MPVGKVAALCGFRDVAYLGKLFRRRFGKTMSDWRL